MNQKQRHHRLLNVLDAEGARIFATLTRLTLRHDVAADLLQELVLRLQSSETFFTAERPAAFAWRTALNLATQWRRKRKRDTAPIDDSIPAAQTSSLDLLIRDEEVAALLDSLDELSELARECFVLHFIDGWSYGDIASQLGKTEHQVRGHCHAAIKQLRERLFVQETEDASHK